MAEVKLFEVTLKYFICAEKLEDAEKEMRKLAFDYASMHLKEIRTGFIMVSPKQKEELVPQLQEPELRLDEVPF